MSDISNSRDYKSFRSSVPQKKIIVDEDGSKVWTMYDSGPRNITCPLICFPPVSGTADVFFRQILALSGRGYRVIALEHPIYWSVAEWCEGFRQLMDHLGLDKVHLFGASLGGYLAQKFAEYTYQCPRVQSLILCNSFCDTSVFPYTDTAFLFWMVPSVVLKKMVMGSFPRKLVDCSIADSLDFMVEKLDSLGQQELASRLTLNCSNNYVNPQKLQDLDITIIDVFDESALTNSVKDSLYKSFPKAKLAHMKSGGNFPYLSRSDEVNLHLLVHLRKHNDTRYQACEYVDNASPKSSLPGSSSYNQSKEDSSVMQSQELLAS